MTELLREHHRLNVRFVTAACVPCGRRVQLNDPVGPEQSGAPDEGGRYLGNFSTSPTTSAPAGPGQPNASRSDQGKQWLHGLCSASG